LALELLGRYEEALQHLSAVSEATPPGEADPRLAKDMVRVADLVQLQKHQQQQKQQQHQQAVQQAEEVQRNEAAAAAAELPAEQQQHAAPAAASTAAGAASVAPKLMPVSVVVSETDSSDDEEEGSEDSERTVTDEAAQEQQQQQQQAVEDDGPIAHSSNDSSSSSSSGGSSSGSEGPSPPGLTWNPFTPYPGDTAPVVQQQQQQLEQEEEGSEEGWFKHSSKAAAVMESYQQLQQEGLLDGDADDFDVSRLLQHFDRFGGLGPLSGGEAGPDDDWMKLDRAGDSPAFADDYTSLLDGPSTRQQQQEQPPKPAKQQQKERKRQGKWEAILASSDTAAKEKQIELLRQQCEAFSKRQQQQQLIKSDDRAKGDAACASGQWNAALRHYNAAISANPSDVRALASRSQVFLKLKRPWKVEEDASAALQLLRQPGSSGLDAASGKALRAKLLYRRAAALKESGKYKEAIAVSRESPSQNRCRVGGRRGCVVSPPGLIACRTWLSQGAAVAGRRCWGVCSRLHTLQIIGDVVCLVKACPATLDSTHGTPDYTVSCLEQMGPGMLSAHSLLRVPQAP